MSAVPRQLARLGLVALACWAGMAPAAAQDYPNKPIRLILPVPPGGGTDFYARTMAAKMSEGLGQPVVVDNRPGGATFIAVSALTRSAPDGYTLLLSADSTFATNPSLFSKLPYDPSKDFTWITLTARFTFLLVVNPALPVNSVAELLRTLKAKPGQWQYASPGPGTQHHLAMLQFAQRTGVAALHVPYKGAAPAVADLIGGHVQLMFLDLATAGPLLKAGKVRALAVVSTDRLPTFPDVPTMAEAGKPGFEAGSWQGIVAPAGTPRRIVDRLNAEIKRATADPTVRQRLLDAGIEPLTSTPETFGELVKAETVLWAEIIRKGGIKLD